MYHEGHEEHEAKKEALVQGSQSCLGYANAEIS